MNDLDQAAVALRDAAAPAGPPADLIAATVAVLEDRLRQQSARVERRRKVMKYVRISSFATAAAVLLAVGLFVAGGGQAVALDKVFDKVANADAVRYQVRDSYGDDTHRTNVVTVKGQAVRVEYTGDAGMTWVVDHAVPGALVFRPSHKVFQTMDLSKAGVMPLDGHGLNVREQLLKLRTQKAEREDTETVAGVKADRYTVTGGKALRQTGNWTLWVGRATGLPVKVRLEMEVPGLPNPGQPGPVPTRTLTRMFEKFDWSPAPAAADFQLDPPDGYTETTIIRTLPQIPPLPNKK